MEARHVDSGGAFPTGHTTMSASIGESCTATLNVGAGSCSAIFNTSGSRTLTASYSGDLNDNTSVSEAVTQDGELKPRNIQHYEQVGSLVETVQHYSQRLQSAGTLCIMRKYGVYHEMQEGA